MFGRVPKNAAALLYCRIDNAGYMTGETMIGGMSTIMAVPGTPKNASEQTLFYFPGAENTDGVPRHGAPPPSGPSRT